MFRPSSLIRNTARTLDNLIGALATITLVFFLIAVGYNLANVPFVSAALDHVLLIKELRQDNKSFWSSSQQAVDIIQNLK